MQRRAATEYSWLSRFPQILRCGVTSARPARESQDGLKSCGDLGLRGVPHLLGDGAVLAGITATGGAPAAHSLSQPCPKDAGQLAASPTQPRVGDGRRSTVAGVLLERGSIAHDVESKSANPRSLGIGGQCRPTAEIGLRRALTLWPERRSRSAHGPDRYCKAPGEIGIQNEPAPILNHSGSAAGGLLPLGARASRAPRDEGREEVVLCDSVCDSVVHISRVSYSHLRCFQCCRRLRLRQRW